MTASNKLRTTERRDVVMECACQDTTTSTPSLPPPRGARAEVCFCSSHVALRVVVPGAGVAGPNEWECALRKNHP